MDTACNIAAQWQEKGERERRCNVSYLMTRLRFQPQMQLMLDIVLNVKKTLFLFRNFNEILWNSGCFALENLFWGQKIRLCRSASRVQRCLMRMSPNLCKHWEQHSRCKEKETKLPCQTPNAFIYFHSNRSKKVQSTQKSSVKYEFVSDWKMRAINWLNSIAYNENSKVWRCGNRTLLPHASSISFSFALAPIAIFGACILMMLWNGMAAISPVTCQFIKSAHGLRTRFIYFVWSATTNNSLQTKRIPRQSSAQVNKQKPPIKMWTSYLNIPIGEFYVFITIAHNIGNYCTFLHWFLFTSSNVSFNSIWKRGSFYFRLLIPICIKFSFFTATNFHVDDDIWFKSLHIAWISFEYRIGVKCSLFFIVFDAEIYLIFQDILNAISVLPSIRN